MQIQKLQPKTTSVEKMIQYDLAQFHQRRRPILIPWGCFLPPGGISLLSVDFVWKRSLGQKAPSFCFGKILEHDIIVIKTFHLNSTPVSGLINLNLNFNNFYPLQWRKSERQLSPLGEKNAKQPLLLSQEDPTLTKLPLIPKCWL